MGTSERREREKQRRMDDIMDAALEVFADKGLRNATMDEIAEKAELSKGTLYLYFKSKEAIFMGVNIRATKMLRLVFAEAARNQPTGIEKTKAIGQAYYKFCEDNPNYFRAISYVQNLGDDAVKAMHEDPMARQSSEHGQVALKVIAEAIQQGHKDGSVRKDIDPMITTVFLWSVSNGVIQMLKNQKAHMKLHDLDISPLMDYFMDFITRGLEPYNNSTR